MTAVAILVHLLLSAGAGLVLCSLRRGERTPGETLATAVLVGIYAETLAFGTLLFAGMSLGPAATVTVAAIVGGAAISWRLRCLAWPRIVFPRPVWYEWALLATVGEKLLFGVWQAARTPLYFDDALTHWSGRAKALYGGVNWSWDPASPGFMGGGIGNRGYPLLTTLWRVLTAKLNLGWNDTIARADGLVFFVVIVLTVWLAVRRFSEVRWLASAAAFTACALPLHAWHTAAGYSDLAVEAFVVASMAALLRGEWTLAGVMAAGAAWSKHDGLVLFLPALLAASAILSHGTREPGRTAWPSVARFCGGFSTLLPWLGYNLFHNLGVSPGSAGYGWHAGAPALLWEKVYFGPTSLFLWIGINAGVAGTCARLFADAVGRALLTLFLMVQGSILFLYCFTDANAFLKFDTTVHRSMMQFSGVAILVVAYGIQLRIAASTARGPRNPISRGSRLR